MSKIKKTDLVKAPEQAKDREEPEIYPITGQPVRRPRVSFVLASIHVLLAIGGSVGAAFGIIFGLSHIPGYERFGMSVAWQRVLLSLLLLIIYTLIVRKRILIFLIRIYQRYAPFGIRCTCTYVPNCSEYMVLSIKKHGLIRGVKKGIKRLLRCQDPCHGFDYP
ncbi:MAG: membrane protein insertion efficiency factor YidD [Clostridia bacterium]|nr:membrane protein insertion efficiency factor YidD [Clostridia bacterium]